MNTRGWASKRDPALSCLKKKKALWIPTFFFAAFEPGTFLETCVFPTTDVKENADTEGEARPTTLTLSEANALWLLRKAESRRFRGVRLVASTKYLNPCTQMTEGFWLTSRWLDNGTSVVTALKKGSLVGYVVTIPHDELKYKRILRGFASKKGLRADVLTRPSLEAPEVWFVVGDAGNGLEGFANLLCVKQMEPLSTEETTAEAHHYLHESNRKLVKVSSADNGLGPLLTTLLLRNTRLK